ncbi:hypothetical protein EZV62_027454 [Acer yangbiense]|uniref:Germin-like protein n=1 Tax=Acer yangbiense TaxID=1000413 RepID=A0A5C7GUA0_9ROSI|nr:hypothetical protein EZV62_027454 [Acer yangbiense]
MATNKMLLPCILALSFSVALASVVPVQDFCVADPNGVACKDPKLVKEDDFFFSGFDKRGNTSNPMGSKVTQFNVAQIPGLNNLGVATARLDFAPCGLNSPHIHPRASEIITVLRGTLEVGFVTSYPELRHFKKVLNKGDMFVFPIGLIHYQKNVGKRHAVAIAAFNSQNPGAIPVATTVFHAIPNIDSGIVAKAFQLDKVFVESIQSKNIAKLAETSAEQEALDTPLHSSNET